MSVACAWQEALRIQWNAIIARSLDKSKFINALASPAGVCCGTTRTSNFDFVASLKRGTVGTDGPPQPSAERELLEAFCSANSQLGSTSQPFGHHVLRLSKEVDLMTCSVQDLSFAQIQKALYPF